jgi:hypothetical protein
VEHPAGDVINDPVGNVVPDGVNQQYLYDARAASARCTEPIFADDLTDAQYLQANSIAMQPVEVLSERHSGV